MQRKKKIFLNYKNNYNFDVNKKFFQKLFGTNKNFVTTQVFLNAREEVFADALTSVSKEFPLVNFGSYPEFIHR